MPIKIDMLDENLDSKNEIDNHLSTLTMNKIDFAKFCEFGDEYFTPISQSEDKDVTFVLGCQNVQFRTNLIDFQEKQPLSRTSSRNESSAASKNGTSRQRTLRNEQKRRLKKELTGIVGDSKKLMFAIQLMKFAECAELSCKDNSEKYEILSITSPKSTGEPTTGIVLEMMVQKTKLAQITIHKAIVKIVETNIEMIEVNNESLKFLTHIKIDSIESHASITVYFALKTLCLMFGNLSLFSSELAVKASSFNCFALLPRKYLVDEKKMEYTKKYISQLFNFVFKKKLGAKEETKEGKDAEKKLNDLINRLLMLGVTPCTVENMNKLLESETKFDLPVLSVSNVKPITDVSKEHEVFQANGKDNYLIDPNSYDMILRRIKFLNQ